jgi:hypothetical protein
MQHWLTQGGQKNRPLLLRFNRTLLISASTARHTSLAHSDESSLHRPRLVAHRSPRPPATGLPFALSCPIDCTRQRIQLYSAGRDLPGDARSKEEVTMTARSARNVETQKKKARRRAARPKLSRPTGNTAGVRRQLKKLAGLRNGRAR